MSGGPSYTPYYGLETSAGRVGLMSCRLCGAAIVIGDEDFDAAAAHDSFHALPPHTDVAEAAVSGMQPEAGAPEVGR